MTVCAFRTNDAETIDAWHNWEAEVRRITDEREALAEEVGLRLICHSDGALVGFDRPDDTKTGDLFLDGALLASSWHGRHNGTMIPNSGRKAGNEMAKRLHSLRMKPLRLPGMPATLFSPNLKVVRPEVWYSTVDRHLYVGLPVVPHQIGRQWTQIRPSQYYFAKEALAERGEIDTAD